MPPKKVVSPSRQCAGRVCGPELPLGPGAKAKYYYAAERCARACDEGSNLCTLCRKYEAAYMTAPDPKDPEARKLRAAAEKFHGRISGAIPPKSHIAGSEWFKEQEALAAAALMAAQRAAEAAEVAAGAAAEADAAAAGGGGGKAKVKAKVAKEEAAVADAAAERAASSAGSISSETKWRIATGRAFASISRGADVAQIERAEEKVLKEALKAAQAAEKRAAGAAIKAVAAAAGAKAAAAAPPPKTRKAGRRSTSSETRRRRIYNAASRGIPAANWLRTPSSPRVSGIRGLPPSPASRRSSSSRPRPSLAAAAAAAAEEPNFADLEAELAAAMGASVLDRNAI